jgi:hypothetical protein
MYLEVFHASMAVVNYWAQEDMIKKQANDIIQSIQDYTQTVQAPEQAEKQEITKYAKCVREE